MHKREQQERTRVPVRALVILNAILLAALAAVTFNPDARAQQRIPGEYTMVGGGAKGTEANVVYIVDTINHEMIAVRYDTTNQTLAGVGGRNLANDAVALMSRGGRNR